ncbi:MAG TPA: hypothetical protein VNR11_04630 [Xanthobacteraceae bacterium]|nr:hypothetical protein [Xanthobacteraceae bacterium]
MLRSLGKTRIAFVGGSAALVLLSLLYAQRDLGAGLEALVMGLIIGGLASVVLYAIMRSIASRKSGSEA